MTTALNNVDIETVAGLAGHISENPDTGDTVWSASVTWNGGFRSEAAIRDFAPLRSDEPTALGGTDTAPNPVEQLLAALGNCLVVGYAANATARGIEIENLEIQIDGDLNLESFLGLTPGHAGFNDIRARVKLDSPASPEEIDELHTTVLASSPVGHTLGAAIPVSVELDSKVSA